MGLIEAAPTLLADAVLDGLIGAGIYRRLLGRESRGALHVSLRWTWKPFVLALVLAILGGIVLVAARHDAHSIADLFRGPGPRR